MGHRATHYWENLAGSGVPRRERRSGEYSTYTPTLLADTRLTILPATDAAVARAERAVRALNRSSHKDLGLVSRFLLRSEAIASSFIEGIAPSPKNVALAELGLNERVLGLSQAAQEVARNMTVVSAATETLAWGDHVRLADLTALQAALITVPTLQGIRTRQNWIGGSSYHPLEAAHVPPPPEEVPDLMEDLVAYMSGAAHSPVIQAALAHAQFETIHPFADGNGRVGRALIHTVFRRRGLTEESILPVSLVLATLQDEYVAGLEAYRFTGEADSDAAAHAINTWVQVFAEAVSTAAALASRLEEDLQRLRMTWQDIIDDQRKLAGRQRAVRRDSALSAILDTLPGTPVLTAATVARIHGVSSTSAQSALQQLADCGILETTSIGQGRRAFISLDVLDLITHSERAMASRSFDTALSPVVRAVPARP